MIREATGQRCINCKALEYRADGALVIVHTKGCPDHRKVKS